MHTTLTMPTDIVTKSFLNQCMYFILSLKKKVDDQISEFRKEINECFCLKEFRKDKKKTYHAVSNLIYFIENE